MPRRQGENNWAASLYTSVSALVEMVQGFGVAINMGPTMASFDRCDGIHSTNVETACYAQIERRISKTNTM